MSKVDPYKNSTLAVGMRNAQIGKGISQDAVTFLHKLRRSVQIAMHKVQVVENLGHQCLRLRGSCRNTKSYGGAHLARMELGRAVVERQGTASAS